MNVAQDKQKMEFALAKEDHDLHQVERHCLNYYFFAADFSYHYIMIVFVLIYCTSTSSPNQLLKI